MTREVYHIAKPIFFVASALIGVTLSAWPRGRHLKATPLQQAILMLGSTILVIALFYPAAMLYVERNVPVRDEGLELAWEYLIFLGPVALCCLVASLASRGIRLVGSVLSLSYLIGGVGVFLVGCLE